MKKLLVVILYAVILIFSTAVSEALTVVPGYWQNDDVYLPQWTSASSDSDIYGRFSGNLNPLYPPQVPYDLMNFNAWSAGRADPSYPLYGDGMCWTASDVIIAGEWTITDYYAGSYYKTVSLYTSPISNATVTLKEDGPWSEGGNIVIENMTGTFSVWQGGGTVNPPWPHCKVTLYGSIDGIYDVTFFLALTEIQPPPYDGSGEVDSLHTEADGPIAWSVEISPPNPCYIDSDEDGTPDCYDNCPNDPGKTEPGICGCGVSDTDTDGDGTPDCNDDCNNLIDSDGDGKNDCDDLCPNDPNKTLPGTCGCGVADIDSDSDYVLDCNDNCPNDPNKTQPGICGCGVADSDDDNDGILDCNDVDDDGDGLLDEEEQGPNGDDPNYDGNRDGWADRLEYNVASFHTYDKQNYVTIESPAGRPISNCIALDNPSPTNSPSGVEFLYGFFRFRVHEIAGEYNTVKLHLPIVVGETVDTYYRYGPTPDNPNNHWYEFLYDGQTGAKINGNVITFYFVDGARGDDDLIVNGIVVDDGAPAVLVDSGAGTTVASDSGGGGCFIATAAYGSLMEPHVKILRDFRDKCLLNNALGKGFVKAYYKYSPPIADFIAKHDNLRAVVRLSLLPLVGISWVALEINPLVTLMLLLSFSIIIIRFVKFRKSNP